MMKRAPAKVVPMERRRGLVLKLLSLRGRVPTIVTIATKATMQTTLSIASSVLVSMI